MVPATEKGARGYSNPDITGEGMIDIIILDEASRFRTEALYKLPRLTGIILAYLDEENTVSFRYQGGRVLCRGLGEELCDFMAQERAEAETAAEEDTGE